MSSDLLNPINNNVQTDDLVEEKTNIGKYVMFHAPDKLAEQILKFSSKFELIGIEFDRQLKNNTKVLILSDAVDANHPIVGKIQVCKIIDGCHTMWVKTGNLILINE